VAVSAIACAMSLIAVVGTAQAQDTAGQQQNTEDRTNSDIVVTGALLRGVAPAGSNTISVSDEDISLSGVVDSNALLTTLVPQSEGFMDVGVLQPGRARQ